MADPTPYDLTYSFSGFQVNSPSTPLPAPELDNELLNIAASVASIIAALEDVRRDDGALPNNIVTFDSLALGLQLLVDPTNGELVAAAIEQAEANAAQTAADRIAAAASAADALTQALAATAAAATINLALYLPKAGNLAGLGSTSTARSNLGLGSVAVFDVGTGALNIIQLDASAKLPAVDGSQLTNIDVLPVGTTIYTNGTTAPAGTLKENGALVSRTTFARLWTFAQASGNVATEANWSAGFNQAFSTGDLATTFRLPDSRGVFIRNFDDGRGVDTARNNSLEQADALKDHTHNYNNPVFNGTASLPTAGSVFATTTTAATTTGATFGTTETRPRNVAKLACIKY